MRAHLQIVAIIGSTLLLLGVFELVRRRRLMERYALLWLASAIALLALSIWGGLLARVAKLIGVYYPPSALFVIAFAFVLILLLHFSIAVSRLADQTKVLAQRVALLEARTRADESAAAAAESEDREQERGEEDLHADDHERRSEHSEALL
jgi:hypothetical protein